MYQVVQPSIWPVPNMTRAAVFRNTSDLPLSELKVDLELSGWGKSVGVMKRPKDGA